MRKQIISERIPPFPYESRLVELADARDFLHAQGLELNNIEKFEVGLILQERATLLDEWLARREEAMKDANPTELEDSGFRVYRNSRAYKKEELDLHRPGRRDPLASALVNASRNVWQNSTEILTDALQVELVDALAST